MRESARDQLSSAAAQQLLTLVWRTLGGGLRWIPEEVIVDQPGRLPSEFAALPIAPAAPVAADIRRALQLVQSGVAVWLVLLCVVAAFYA